MKIQTRVPLTEIYKREEEFSDDLAEHLQALEIGTYEDFETESKVGTRRADIVATSGESVLVVENQFGKADWDHWGRLEAYARLKEASVAALVAESFEELMIVTCNLRNEDSQTDWYLIQAEANSHRELSFHKIAFPAIDIQTERSNVEYSDFWEPIRSGGLFKGKPVPVRDDGWICKSIRGIDLTLNLNKTAAEVRLYFKGDDRNERREKAIPLVKSLGHPFEPRDAAKLISLIFPAIDKGKNDIEHWPEIRESLTKLGKEIYKVIHDSDI